MIKLSEVTDQIGQRTCPRLTTAQQHKGAANEAVGAWALAVGLSKQDGVLSVAFVIAPAP